MRWAESASGLSTPAVKLHLDSGATTELRIDGEAHELITFHKSSAQKGLVGYSNSDSTLKLCAGSGTIASNVNGISINADGNVGIGTASPAAKLHVYGGGITLANDQILSIGTTSGNSGRIRLYGNSGTAYYMDYQPVGTNDRQFRFNGSSSGSAYTTFFNQQHPTANHNLYVDGDITSAGTGRYIYGVNLNVTGYKNFEIEHPTKENMMLVHSSLEGPEAGVYYRGRAQSDTITLPDLLDRTCKRWDYYGSIDPKWFISAFICGEHLIK